MAATAGAISFVIEKLGRALRALSTKSCTASYCPKPSMRGSERRSGTDRLGTSDDGQVRALEHEAPDEVGSGVDEVLAVVEHEHGVGDSEMVDQGVGEAACRLRADPDRRGDDGGDGLGVADRGQVDQPSSIGMLVEYSGGQFEGQPRLATSAGSGERQHARFGEQLLQHGQLGLASHEAGELHGKVVGNVFERAEGREVGTQVGAEDLEDVLSSAQVTQAVRPEVLEGHVVGEVPQPDWRPTVPQNGLQTLAIVSGQDVAGLDFGNTSTAPAVLGVDSPLYSVLRQFSMVRLSPLTDRR